jgi:hypothetical protein
VQAGEVLPRADEVDHGIRGFRDPRDLGGELVELRVWLLTGQAQRP